MNTQTISLNTFNNLPKRTEEYYLNSQITCFRNRAYLNTLILLVCYTDISTL